MRKFIAVVAGLVVAVAAQAGEMDQAAGSCTVAAAATNSFTTSIKGTIESIVWTMATASTATVSLVSSDGQTIFAATSLNPTTDGVFYPVYERAPLTGGAITNSANTVWKFPVVGTLTATAVGASASSTVGLKINYVR